MCQPCVALLGQARILGQRRWRQRAAADSSNHHRQCSRPSPSSSSWPCLSLRGRSSGLPPCSMYRDGVASSVLTLLRACMRADGDPSRYARDAARADPAGAHTVSLHTHACLGEGEGSKCPGTAPTVCCRLLAFRSPGKQPASVCAPCSAHSPPALAHARPLCVPCVARSTPPLGVGSTAVVLALAAVCFATQVTATWYVGDTQGEAHAHSMLATLQPHAALCTLQSKKTRKIA